MIRLHDKDFVPYLSVQDIDASVKLMAAKINADYEGTEPTFIGVLNGSFMFVSDLMKEISLNCTLSFIKFQSYQGTTTTGDVKRMIGLETSIKGKDVIILEDIVDTGNTILAILEELKKAEVKSVKIASLLLKPDVFDKDYKVDYVGKEIPNKFVVGYGLDYDGLGRNLKEIYQLEQN